MRGKTRGRDKRERERKVTIPRKVFPLGAIFPLFEEMDDSSRSSSTVGVPKFLISWRIFIFFDYPSFIIAVYLNLVIEKWKEEENDSMIKRM